MSLICIELEKLSLCIAILECPSFRDEFLLSNGKFGGTLSLLCYFHILLSLILTLLFSVQYSVFLLNLEINFVVSFSERKMFRKRISLAVV